MRVSSVFKFTWRRPSAAVWMSSALTWRQASAAVWMSSVLRCPAPSSALTLAPRRGLLYPTATDQNAVTQLLSWATTPRRRIVLFSSIAQERKRGAEAPRCVQSPVTDARAGEIPAPTAPGISSAPMPLPYRSLGQDRAQVDQLGFAGVVIDTVVVVDDPDVAAHSHGRAFDLLGGAPLDTHDAAINLSGLVQTPTSRKTRTRTALSREDCMGVQRAPRGCPTGAAHGCPTGAACDGSESLVSAPVADGD